MYVASVDYMSSSFDALYELRKQVLRDPLNLVFTIDQILQEQNQYHFGVYSHYDKLLGVAILAQTNYDNTLKMRQVAVVDDFQGKGVGSYLLSTLEHWSLLKGYTTLELHARLNAVSFYEHRGYERRGEKFTEVGLDHYYMTKLLV